MKVTIIFSVLLLSAMKHMSGSAVSDNFALAKTTSRSIHVRVFYDHAKKNGYPEPVLL